MPPELLSIKYVVAYGLETTIHDATTQAHNCRRKHHWCNDNGNDSDFGTKYGYHLTSQKSVMFMSAKMLQRELIVGGSRKFGT